jgi:hypothetical protein
MPTKAQYDKLCSDVLDAFHRNGFDPVAWKVQGQSRIEQEILAKKDNLFTRSFDPDTHGSIEFYKEFVEKRDLKLLWARVNSSRYKLDPIELYNRCPDRCPAMGVLLDYGMGRNKVTDNTYFLPGQDHIVAVANGGKRFGDTTNIQVITQFINTVKNQGTILDAMKWLFFEVSKNNQ